MSSPKLPLQSPLNKTRLTPSERTEIVLSVLFDPIDVIGRAVMGDLWKTLCDTFRDAIALSLLLKIPGLIGAFIIGKDFSGFDICMQEGAFGVSRYACFIIVMADFCLWIVLAGRILSRLVIDFHQLIQKKGKKP